MLAIPSALQAKLDAGVTTLCRCWQLTLNDGLTLGFTDHDEDVPLGSVTCRAATGLTASEANRQLGLAVTGAEISGALADDTLNEADLAAGRYDNAAVEVWLVDWSEPSLRVLLAKGVLGEVRRAGSAFAAEVRSLSYRLNEESGRRFSASCTADLGDGQCTINLNADAYRGAGGVAAISATSAFAASGLGAFADGWFSSGRLVWGSGANAGVAVEVKTHRNAGAGITLELWQAMPEPIAAGDTFIVTAGCDKRFATCTERFNNVANFRGFPHIPGNDFIVRYPLPGEPGNNGGSLQ